MHSSSFNVAQDYRGPRNIVVPCKMYSKKGLLKALHVKSRRWLGIDLDRYVLSFHKNRGDHDPSEEIHFSRIRSVDADMSKSLDSKYYLSVMTDSHSYSFKFKNVRDFYNVVEALRHTLHNNQPVYVTREDFTKLASLHQNTIMASSNLHQDTAHIDISSDDEAEVDRRHAQIVPVPVPVPVAVGNNFDPTSSIMAQAPPTQSVPVPVPVAVQTQPANVTTTVTEHTETVETIVESPAIVQHVRPKEMTQEEYQYLKWKYQDRFQQGEQRMDVPPQFRSFYERDDDPHGHIIERRQVFENVHAQLPSLMTPVREQHMVHVEQMTPVHVQQMTPVHVQQLTPVHVTTPIVQSHTVVTPSHNIVTPTGDGSLRANSQVITSTTTTFTNPGYVAGQVTMTETEWRGMERQIIEQEKLVALKNEELRAREAALHAYKIQLKQQEILAKADIMAKKEAELAALEAEIKGIQTEITTIHNHGQLYQQDLRTYNESLIAQKNVALGIVPHRQPETVAITVEESSVVEEKITQPVTIVESQQLVQGNIPFIATNQEIRL